MKKNTFSLPILVVALLVMISCQKQNQQISQRATSVTESNAAVACQATYFQLILDPGGISYMFKTLGSPTTGGPLLSGIIGSYGDNVIREAGTTIPITFVTGIAYEPISGIVTATTSPASNYPNRILRFPISNPSIATHVAMVSSCGILLNVSDIEYNITNGRYYAINRGSTAFNNRIVVINPGAPTNVVCMPATVPVARQLRGLTFGCNGQGYVMQMNGPNGKIISFNLATGALSLPACNYTGIIAPGAPAASFPEMGLHFDCSCSGLFITGNFDPTSGASLLTDGMASCIGAPSYASLTGVIKPTVDFARP